MTDSRIAMDFRPNTAPATGDHSCLPFHIPPDFSDALVKDYRPEDGLQFQGLKWLGKKPPHRRECRHRACTCAKPPEKVVLPIGYDVKEAMFVREVMDGLPNHAEDGVRSSIVEPQLIEPMSRKTSTARGSSKQSSLAWQIGSAGHRSSSKRSLSSLLKEDEVTLPAGASEEWYSALRKLLELRDRVSELVQGDEEDGDGDQAAKNKRRSRADTDQAEQVHDLLANLRIDEELHALQTIANRTEKPLVRFFGDFIASVEAAKSDDDPTHTGPEELELTVQRLAQQLRKGLMHLDDQRQLVKLETEAASLGDPSLLFKAKDLQQAVNASMSELKSNSTRSADWMEQPLSASQRLVARRNEILEGFTESSNLVSALRGVIHHTITTHGGLESSDTVMRKVMTQDELRSVRQVNSELKEGEEDGHTKKSQLTFMGLFIIRRVWADYRAYRKSWSARLREHKRIKALMRFNFEKGLVDWQQDMGTNPRCLSHPHHSAVPHTSPRLYLQQEGAELNLQEIERRLEAVELGQDDLRSRQSTRVGRVTVVEQEYEAEDTQHHEDHSRRQSHGSNEVERQSLDAGSSMQEGTDSTSLRRDSQNGAAAAAERAWHKNNTFVFAKADARGAAKGLQVLFTLPKADAAADPNRYVLKRWEELKDQQQGYLAVLKHQVRFFRHGSFLKMASRAFEAAKEATAAMQAIDDKIEEVKESLTQDKVRISRVLAVEGAEHAVAQAGRKLHASIINVEAKFGAELLAIRASAKSTTPVVEEDSESLKEALARWPWESAELGEETNTDPDRRGSTSSLLGEVVPPSPEPISKARVRENRIEKRQSCLQALETVLKHSFNIGRELGSTTNQWTKVCQARVSAVNDLLNDSEAFSRSRDKRDDNKKTEKKKAFKRKGTTTALARKPSFHRRPSQVTGEYLMFLQQVVQPLQTQIQRVQQEIVTMKDRALKAEGACETLKSEHDMQTSLADKFETALESLLTAHAEVEELRNVIAVEEAELAEVRKVRDELKNENDWHHEQAMQHMQQADLKPECPFRQGDHVEAIGADGSWHHALFKRLHNDGSASVAWYETLKSARLQVDQIRVPLASQTVTEPQADIGPPALEELPAEDAIQQESVSGEQPALRRSPDLTSEAVASPASAAASPSALALVKALLKDVAGGERPVSRGSSDEEARLEGIRISWSVEDWLASMADNSAAEANPQDSPQNYVDKMAETLADEINIAGHQADDWAEATALAEEELRKAKENLASLLEQAGDDIDVDDAEDAVNLLQQTTNLQEETLRLRLADHNELLHTLGRTPSRATEQADSEQQQAEEDEEEVHVDAPTPLPASSTPPCSPTPVPPSSEGTGQDGQDVLGHGNILGSFSLSPEPASLVVDGRTPTPAIDAETAQEDSQDASVSRPDTASVDALLQEPPAVPSIADVEDGADVASAPLTRDSNVSRASMTSSASLLNQQVSEVVASLDFKAAASGGDADATTASEAEAEQKKLPRKSTKQMAMQERARHAVVHMLHARQAQRGPSPVPVPARSPSASSATSHYRRHRHRGRARASILQAAEGLQALLKASESDGEDDKTDPIMEERSRAQYLWSRVRAKKAVILALPSESSITTDQEQPAATRGPQLKPRGDTRKPSQGHPRRDRPRRPTANVIARKRAISKAAQKVHSHFAEVSKRLEEAAEEKQQEMEEVLQSLPRGEPERITNDDSKGIGGISLRIPGMDRQNPKGSSTFKQNQGVLSKGAHATSSPPSPASGMSQSALQSPSSSSRTAVEASRSAERKQRSPMKGRVAVPNVQRKVYPARATLPMKTTEIVFNPEPLAGEPAASDFLSPLRWQLQLNRRLRWFLWWQRAVLVRPAQYRSRALTQAPPQVGKMSLYRRVVEGLLPDFTQRLPLEHALAAQRRFVASRLCKAMAAPSVAPLAVRPPKARRPYEPRIRNQRLPQDRADSFHADVAAVRAARRRTPSPSLLPNNEHRKDAEIEENAPSPPQTAATSSQTSATEGISQEETSAGKTEVKDLLRPRHDATGSEIFKRRLSHRPRDIVVATVPTLLLQQSQGGVSRDTAQDVEQQETEMGARETGDSFGAHAAASAGSRSRQSSLASALAASAAGVGSRRQSSVRLRKLLPATAAALNTLQGFGLAPAGMQIGPAEGHILVESAINADQDAGSIAEPCPEPPVASEETQMEAEGLGEAARVQLERLEDPGDIEDKQRLSKLGSKESRVSAPCATPRSSPRGSPSPGEAMFAAGLLTPTEDGRRQLRRQRPSSAASSSAISWPGTPSGAFAKTDSFVVGHAVAVSEEAPPLAEVLSPSDEPLDSRPKALEEASSLRVGKSLQCRTPKSPQLVSGRSSPQQAPALHLLQASVVGETLRPKTSGAVAVRSRAGPDAPGAFQAAEVLQGLQRPATTACASREPPVRSPSRHQDVGPGKKSPQQTLQLTATGFEGVTTPDKQSTPTGAPVDARAFASYGTAVAAAQRAASRSGGQKPWQAQSTSSPQPLPTLCLSSRQDTAGHTSSSGQPSPSPHLTVAEGGSAMKVGQAAATKRPKSTEMRSMDQAHLPRQYQPKQAKEPKQEGPARSARGAAESGGSEVVCSKLVDAYADNPQWATLEALFAGIDRMAFEDADELSRRLGTLVQSSKPMEPGPEPDSRQGEATLLPSIDSKVTGMQHFKLAKAQQTAGLSAAAAEKSFQKRTLAYALQQQPGRGKA